mmetsp:Transcript_18089/g.50224  ORF Transcript_18089/g.50224 Transcript_18089/m.50224 type:complete len:84 (-) Transcript_18089:590-841(-)
MFGFRECLGRVKNIVDKNQRIETREKNQNRQSHHHHHHQQQHQCRPQGQLNCRHHHRSHHRSHHVVDSDNNNANTKTEENREI